MMTTTCLILWMPLDASLSATETAPSVGRCAENDASAIRATNAVNDTTTGRAALRATEFLPVREHHWRSWRLVEVKIVHEITQLRCRFIDGLPRVGSAVGFGIEALAPEEIVLDEFVIRVVAQRLMVDVALFRVGADDDARYA